MRLSCLLLLVLPACAPPSADSAEREVREDTSEDTDCEASVWYPDADDDGYGVEGGSVEACEASTGFVPVAGDCDDDDPDVHPDAEEVCDPRDVDEDCDGQSDDADDDVRETERWYRDDDGDGYGDDVLSACEAPDGYVDEPSDCDDTQGGINPAAEEVCGDGIDQDCGGATEECRLTGSGTPEGADGVVFGGAGAVSAGVIVASGDTDGDGTGDLVIGTHRMGSVREYGLYVVAGPLAPTATLDDARTVLATGTQSQSGSFVEAVVAADTNGDGTDEVVLANYLSGSDLGRVRIYDLGAAGAFSTTDALAELSGVEVGDRFGEALSVGDVDGDGVVDLVAGASAWNGGVGAAWVLRGPLLGAVSASDHLRISGDVSEGATGGAVAVLGDVDGDGVDDVAVGSSDERCERSPCEVFHVFHGPLETSLSLDDADASFETWLWSGNPGLVRAAGDADGDGRADLWLGDDAAVEYGNNGCTQGAAYLFEGPLSGTKSVDEADAIIYGANCSDGAAASMAPGADVDSDGKSDLLLGMDSSSSGGSGSTNAVFLFYGPLSGEHHTDEADLIITPPPDLDDGFGAELALGQVIGDAALDLIVGTSGWDEDEAGEGAVHVWAGALAD